MDVNKFLKKENTEPEPENFWDKVVQPKASYLITGDVGTGKSGLAYFILERYSEKYNLTPAVVGLPKEKRDLVPGNFEFLTDISEIPSMENAIVFIDEADIQLPLDSNKDKEAVINFLSLPRQRKQLFILAYHFPLAISLAASIFLSPEILNPASLHCCLNSSKLNCMSYSMILS